MEEGKEKRVVIVGSDSLGVVAKALVYLLSQPRSEDTRPRLMAAYLEESGRMMASATQEARTRLYKSLGSSKNSNSYR